MAVKVYPTAGGANVVWPDGTVEFKAEDPAAVAAYFNADGTGAVLAEVNVGSGPLYGPGGVTGYRSEEEARAANPGLLGNPRTTRAPDGSLIYSYPTTTQGPGGSNEPYANRQREVERITGQPTVPSPTSGAPITAPGPPEPEKDLSKARSAKAFILETLIGYGFSEADAAELANFAWGMLVGGAGQAEAMLELRKQPAFRNFFPEIEALRKNNVAVSPADIVNFRIGAQALLRSYGLPSGFYDDRKDFERWIVGQKSLVELGNQLDEYQSVVDEMAGDPANAPILANLERMHGIGRGGLLAYAIDADTALPVLKRQIGSARIGARAEQAGFGTLSRSEAEGIFGASATAREAVLAAEAGFGELVDQRELFGVLPGFERSETAIGREQQLGSQFGGDAVAKRRIRLRARERTAGFEGGGSISVSREGLSGLGVR